MSCFKVNEQERKGAEIDYLKKFGPDWLKAGGNQDLSKDNPDIEFQAQHPRFCHLVSSMITSLKVLF